MIAFQLAEYVHIFTLGISRPFGASVFLTAWDKKVFIPVEVFFFFEVLKLVDSYTYQGSVFLGFSKFCVAENVCEFDLPDRK